MGLVVNLPLFAAGEFGFHFPLQPGLQVSLAFPRFQKDTGFVDAAFETAKGLVEAFVFFNDGFDCHANHLLPADGLKDTLFLRTFQYISMFLHGTGLIQAINTKKKGAVAFC